MEKDMSGDGDLSLQIEKVFIISTFRQLELRIKPWNHRSELTSLRVNSAAETILKVDMRTFFAMRQSFLSNIKNSLGFY